MTRHSPSGARYVELCPIDRDLRQRRMVANTTNRRSARPDFLSRSYPPGGLPGIGKIAPCLLGACSCLPGGGGQASAASGPYWHRPSLPLLLWGFRLDGIEPALDEKLDHVRAVGLD